MKLYCVVGMHRSGTSVVSRMLSLLGASLGPPEDFMDPKPDNPTGFWETKTIASLHDDLLAAQGGRWDAPPFLEEGWEQSPRFDSFRERIRRAIDSHFASADVAVWKDPRGSLLLPVWRAVTEISGTILVARDPGEVATSLHRRDGIEPDKGVRLWLRYMVEAFRSDPAHLLVSHSDLYARPGWVASRLAAYCQLPPPSAEASQAVASFIDPRLRRAGGDVADAKLLPLARAFHRTLMREHRDVSVPFADLIHAHLRMKAEAQFVRDRLSRLVDD